LPRGTAGFSSQAAVEAVSALTRATAANSHHRRGRGAGGESTVDASIDSSSSTTSLMDCHRSSGSFARQRRTSLSSGAGVNGFASIGVGSAAIIAPTMLP
jgi:hypothetical protein